jgi:hypothetical protein
MCMFNNYFFIKIMDSIESKIRIRALAIFGFRFKINHSPHSLMQNEKLEKNVNTF